MDSDGELDIVEQAERSALQENLEDGGEDTQEVQREASDDEVEADGNDDEAATRRVIKPKRVVRNPQPKLNAETLRGPRGLTALPALFAKQKFKGKGHEESDLNVILQTYQYWCHRLFPKMRFDQCIEKIETLGNKKQVMAYVKRIRMGLLEEEPPEPQEDACSDEETHTTPQQQQQIESVESRFDAFAQQKENTIGQELTEEQKEIMRVNKERAMKLRAERLQRIQKQAEEKLATSSMISSQPSLLESTNNSQSEEVQVLNQDKELNSMDIFGNEDEENEFMALSNQLPGQVMEETQEEEIDVDEMLNDLQSTATIEKGITQIASENGSDIMEGYIDGDVYNNAN